MSIPGVLSGRQINWCEDGNDEYVYCCSYFYLGDDKPSCCRFPIHTGLLITLSICAVFLILLLTFLYCWFCPTSCLNRRRPGYTRPR